MAEALRRRTLDCEPPEVKREEVDAEADTPRVESAIPHGDLARYVDRARDRVNDQVVELAAGRRDVVHFLDGGGGRLAAPHRDG